MLFVYCLDLSLRPSLDACYEIAFLLLWLFSYCEVRSSYLRVDSDFVEASFSTSLSENVLFAVITTLGFPRLIPLFTVITLFLEGVSS